MGRKGSVASPRAATLLPRAQVPTLDRPATGLLVTLAGVSFVAHMLVAGNYGYFRDELYYLADGRHLQLGYVDQPLLMGWLAALVRVTAGDSLVAIHVIPALACALIIVVTGLMARELGGGRVAQFVAGVAALFSLDFMATGSIFSMDVLDQLWWALASLSVVRLLRRDAPRLWLLVGLVAAIALLTKLTVLFFGLALVLALLVTPERRYLRTPWPWLAGGIAFLGLLPYLIWNAVNGWPTWEFWQHYRRRHQPAGLLRRADRADESDRRAPGRRRPGLLLSQDRRALSSAGLGIRLRLSGAHPHAHEAVLPGARLPHPVRGWSGGVRASPTATAARLDPARLCRPACPRRNRAGAGCHAHPAACHGRASLWALDAAARRSLWLG